jgi:5-methylcytosine-specific restriction endonuclease McrA
MLNDSSEVTSSASPVKTKRKPATPQKTYSEKLRDPRWQEMRLRVMQRDGFMCRDCHRSDSELQVHHCFYEKGNPWDTDPDLLMTLCAFCHGQRQDMETDIRRRLGRIFTLSHQSDLCGLLNSLNEWSDEHSEGPLICTSKQMDRMVDVLHLMDKWGIKE